MIHINIGSNLDSNYGDKFKNISVAINLIIESKIKIIKVSDFYETPSYPNKNFHKFINIGALIECNFDHLSLLKKISLIEKKLGEQKQKKITHEFVILI
jgi:2-amino-4-hydroxy-6-hydroxymethyldihydropteridine diphosphokinase